MKQNTSYFNRLISTLEKNISCLEEAANFISDEIIRIGAQRSNVWLIGNGGSASTAEHFETDLAFIRHDFKNLAPVSSLTSNSALITAAANDVSYDDIFKVILQRKIKEGDLLISISASGNSKNILKAIEFARSEGVRTVSILGFDGGRAKEISDFAIVVNTDIGDYGITEDIHLSICHAASAAIQKRCAVEFKF